MKPTRVALIGAGNISDQYLTNLGRYPDIEVAAVTDRDPEVARRQAEKYGVAASGTPDLALNDPSIELIFNLTIPSVHAEVSAAALRAGKHVWSEKPLALDRESAQELLDLAASRGLRLGCAPDTVLCPGIQGSLAALGELASQAGETPFRARMLFQYHGPDAWHPNPEFLFQPGAGPLLDYGPYYLTTAVLALGPVKRVAGSVGVRPRLRRQVEAGPLAGTVFDVNVPTTVVALLEHQSGAFTDITLSFDAHTLREEVEFQTASATVIATDPNRCDGVVRTMFRKEEVSSRNTDDPVWGRGVGAVDMVRSIAANRPHRASGELAYHVLDVMLSIADSIETGESVTLTSTTAPVDLIPAGWRPDVAWV
ncbi:MAG: Gfo/Idh/MocA family oxidoreductase [Actinobacteria bacterium]|nr:Gfo/Idh/MocA family oxidoreductase [Actinomycetota bacterium]